MSIKKCDKCGEMVGEAKAFCPGCGYSFEDEQERKAESEFEATSGTVQFSKSAFNMLLSDMGLNISEAPNPTGNPPANKAVELSPVPAHQTESNTPKNPADSKRTLIIVLITLLILFILGVLIAAAVLYVIFFRNF
jgi:hypothetical protein